MRPDKLNAVANPALHRVLGRVGGPELLDLLADSSRVLI